MVKVCIVGAGLSGLTVAHELIEKGFEVVVYEKHIKCVFFLLFRLNACFSLVNCCYSEQTRLCYEMI